MSRVLKRLIIGLVYVGILLLLTWPVYRLFVAAPSCTDKVQNQSEEGVDCGTVCGVSCPPALISLTSRPPVILNTAPGNYDVLTRIDNPNAIYGATSVPYTLTLTDAAGGQLGRRTGTTYVNPAQPRYLVVTFNGLSSAPVKAELQFDSSAVQWGALQIDAAGAVAFAVRDEQLTSAAASVRYAATVTNRSAFDFDYVDITVLLRDQSGAVVAAGVTVARTLVANQSRGFIVDWPFAVPGAVRAEAIVTTNVFDNQNFIRTHGSPERFQDR